MNGINAGKALGLSFLVAGMVCGASVVEPVRQLPWVQDTDVVVVGGSSGAVAAAQRAATNGAKVFLVRQRPFRLLVKARRPSSANTSTRWAASRPRG
jgi:hypothetical protein